jgi:hypothetical protein
MTDDLRDCPGCGSERPFILRHPEPGCCPDSADGCCPEWFCTACGTALLAGVLSFGRELTRVPDSAAGSLDRVA